MKKYMYIIIIAMLMMYVPRVSACVIEYEEYKDFGIKQSYIVGDYVFVADQGYSPSLEDFAIAARTIPEDEEEYIYNILITKIGTKEFFRFVEIFSNEESRDEADFPYIDVTYEYRANIRGASEKDYDIYTCKVDTIKVNYTTLETEGELEYKTSATRTVNVTSNDGISGLKYCTTNGNECTPTKETTLENDLAKIEYESMLGGQRICVEAKDKNGNTSGIVCDETLVKVDKDRAKVEATEELQVVVEKEPHTVEELFEINYSVSGGDVTHYYYVEEAGEKTKYLLGNLADLPSGNIEVEAKVDGGNGLVTKESRIIEVVKSKVTYDYKTNGGYSSDIETYEVAYKGKAKLTEKAYKNGYEFVGWNRDKDAEYGEEVVEVTENTTLYAIFKKEVTASFEILSYDGSVPATSEYKEVTCEKYNNEEECEVKVPRISAKVGYEAFGWSKEEDKEVADYVGEESITITGNTTLYSVTRKKNASTATFVVYKNGTVAEELKKCYIYNGRNKCSLSVDNITSDNYEGKTLAGFTKDKNNVEKVTTFETGTTYYAYYEDVYNVKYLSGKTKEEVEEAKVYYVVTKTGVEEIVEEITLKSAEVIDGYAFIGYRKDSEIGEAEAKPGDKVRIEGDTTYSAIYVSTFKITYKEEADVLNTPGEVSGTKYYVSRTREEVPYELVLNNANEISKDGHVFVNWVINGEKYDAGEKVSLSEETVVEAEWSIDGCRIIFDYWTNGGVSATKSSITYINGREAVDVSGVTASKTGWTFIGWTDKQGSATNPLTTYKPTNTDSDVTLYAMYKKEIVVQFRVQDTNAFNMSQDERKTYTLYNQQTEATTVMPTVTTVDDKYEFVGWSKEAKAYEKEYDARESVSVSKNTIFYTITREKTPVVVRYYYMDETEKVAYEEVECNKYNREETCEVTPSVLTSTYKESQQSGYSKNSESIEETDEYIVENDKAYYAIYDKVLTVKYNSGILKASQPITTTNMRYLTNLNGVSEYKATLILDTPDGIQGYQALGWREDEESEAAEYESGSTIEINSDKEYFGVYERAITISYTSLGGTTTPSGETKTLIYNTVEDTDQVEVKFTLAPSVVKEGYDFLGWMKGNAGEGYPAGSEISLKESTKMYAKWQAAKFNVTYNYQENGGDSVTLGSKSTVFGTEIDLTVSATKAGYEFVGWSSEANSSVVLDSLEMPASDTTLYAVFRKPLKATWIVTDINSGILEKPETICYKYNNETECKVETGNLTANEGYTVSGWTETQGSIEVTIGNHAQTIINKDTEFYSITRKTDPLVGTFYYGTESDAITTVTSNCYLYNGVSKCTITEPLKPTSYKESIYLGWSSKKDSVEGVTYEISANTGYYAHYSKIIDIIYHDGANNNIITDTDTVEYILSDTGDDEKIPVFTIRTPTAISGYTTLGWTENAEAHGNKTQDSNVQKSTSISYEYYGTYNRTITLAYNANNGSSTPTKQTDTQWYHSLLGATSHTFKVAAAITRPGYTFINWAKGSATGEQVAAQSDITLTGDLTLYAVWTVNNYKVSFDSNGGTAVSTVLDVTYDKAYGTLPTTTYQHNEFLGWYTAKTGGTKITSESIVKITSDTTLYAHWQTVKAPVLTGGGVAYAPSRTISIATAGSAYSGLDYYEYYVTTGTTSPTANTTATGTTTGSYIFNANGNYYIWYRTVAKSGIKSAWSSSQQARIDIDDPVADLRIETISGEKYLVFDTYDTISGIDKLLDGDGNEIVSSEIPLKIYVNGYTTDSKVDNNDYEQLMEDMGYTDYKVAHSTYPTAASLVADGYNVFVDNKNVWAPNEILNEYFSNGINIISIGNDASSALTPITLNYQTTEPSTFSVKTNNVFTKKLGVLDNGTSQTDSRQRIKFVSGTEILYKEVFDSDGSEYDGIGYYTSNGTKWIHSQMALTSSLLPYIDASLSYMSNKGLYYYKLEYKGINNFTLYDKAGNAKAISYDYSKTLPTLSVSNSELYSAYTSYSPTNTITYDGNGTLSVTSSDTSIAKVSLSDKTITITGGSTVGTATITVNASETSTYNSRAVTFVVHNRFDSTLAWGTPTVNNETKKVTLPYTYTGDGALSVSVNDSTVGTATIDTANKVIIVDALSIGQLEVKLMISTGKNYYQNSITKVLTFGAAASSNSTAFQTALTTWGVTGTASDENWYGSTTDSHIYSPDGSYVILESVNTNNFTGYYYKENGVTPCYQDITLDFDMTTTSTDDDAIGAMIRFNPESTTNYWSGYLLFLDKHDSSGNGIGNGAYNGLWRANNKQFSTTGLYGSSGSTKLVYNASITWARNKWQHYKFQALGNKLTVWRWDTNTTGKYVPSDSNKIFEYTDTSTSAITCGSYGFWTYSQSYAQFKNFVAVTGDPNNFEITVE